MARSELRYWTVNVRGMKCQHWARSAGGAARKAFRLLISIGWMKRQPKTDHETGGWEKVSIECTQ